MNNGASQLLQIDNLRTVFRFGDRTLVAVNNISMTVGLREIVGIVGESGSGKTMTALSLIGIVPHPGVVESGCALLRGRNLLAMSNVEMRAFRGRDISLVYQDPLSSLNPSFNILWHFEEILRAHSIKLSRRARIDSIIDSLRLVRIPNPENRLYNFPHQLSGGMRQRIVIAMALILHPSLIIADEPTTALDVTTQKEIFNLIEKLRQELSISYIVISHNLHLIGERCDRIYVMYAGQIVESGLSEDIFRSPLHPYTRGLMNSIPKLGSGETELHVIRGEVQDLMNLPQGCFFSSRCEHMEPKCQSCFQNMLPATSSRNVRCWKYDQISARLVS